MGEDYVVLKAVHPSWCTTHLPRDVAELLEISSDMLRGLHRPARAIAFLSRNPGTLRVLNLYRGGDRLANIESRLLHEVSEEHLHPLPF